MSAGQFYGPYFLGAGAATAALAISGAFDGHSHPATPPKAPVSRVVPCSPSQSARAVVHGGTGQFAVGGETVTVKAPNGWCLE